MTMQPPPPGQASPQDVALRVWVLLDADAKEEAQKLMFEQAAEEAPQLLRYYIDQAGLEDGTPDERKQGYRQRPLENWETLRLKYRPYYDEDLRDFRKLDPEGAQTLEHILDMLTAAMQQQMEAGNGGV